MNSSIQDDDLGIETFEEVYQRQNPSSSAFDAQSLKRRGRRYIARGIESIAGLPGDIIQTIRSISSPEERDQNKDNFVKRAGRSLLESLPGSEELRARTAELYPELEPKDNFEEVEDEVVGDFATLALPVKGKIPFARSLGLSVIGNLGKEAMKNLGFEEATQEATKLGLMLFSGMFGKGRGVNNYIRNLYKEAEKFAPQDARISYPSKKLENVEKLISKGSLNDAKEPVANLIQEIKFKSPGGSMSVEDAVQFDHDINRAIAKSGADRTKKGYLKQLKKAHMEALGEYAKENPSWGENYYAAQQAYKGIETSQAVQNYIRRNMNLKNFAYASALLGLGHQYLPGSAGEKLGSIGTTAGLLYGATVARRLATNPALRRYYANVLKASLSENKAMLARNLKGLDRVAKKDFEERPDEMFETIEFEED